MPNTFPRTRAVAIWCMSMLTLGAWHIASGADMPPALVEWVER